MSDGVYEPMLRLIFALPVVLVLAYLVVKYGYSNRMIAMGRRRRMRLVEQLPLGPKTALNLVQVGNRYYLFAQQEGAFAVLKELETLPEELNESMVRPADVESILIGKMIGFAKEKRKGLKKELRYKGKHLACARR